MALPRPIVHLGDDLTPYQLSDRENLKLEESLIDNSIDRFDSSSDVLWIGIVLIGIVLCCVSSNNFSVVTFFLTLNYNRLENIKIFPSRVLVRWYLIILNL